MKENQQSLDSTQNGVFSSNHPKALSNILKEYETMCIVLENSRDGITMMELATGQYVYMSPSVTEITGFSRGELIDMTPDEISELVLPADRKVIKELQNNIDEGKELQNDLEYRFRLKNGEYHWFRSRCKLVLNEEGKPFYLVSITRDVDEYKKLSAEIKLKDKKILENEIEKAEALNSEIKTKDEFLTLVSHEFRTPVTVIASAVKAIQKICSDSLPGKAKKYLEFIIQSCNRQQKLINNLLDITRLRMENIHLNLEDIDITALTQAVTAAAETYALKKGIKLTFQAEVKSKFIAVDRELLERVLLNLLSNAVKFSPEGSPVIVVLYEKALNGRKMVHIEIKDKGIGITPEKKDLIFKRFGQADNSLSRQAEGVGIGLYLSRSFLHLMGGEITFESCSGKGSTFCVMLPDACAENIAADIAVNDRLINDDHLTKAAAIEFSDIYF